MSPILNLLDFERLEHAVRALCPVIEQRVRARATAHLTEYALRRELVACILGSQVRYEMASASLEAIEQAGLIEDVWWHRGDQTFEGRVLRVLSGSDDRRRSKPRYRFPKTRASQIARARDAVAQRALSQRLGDASEPRQLRQRLVEEISGLGPKQASMFLRNTGWTYSLAILDRHVLRFMARCRPLCLGDVGIGTLVQYERVERIAVDYASILRYPVGYLDWAIWATMRAAGELGL